MKTNVDSIFNWRAALNVCALSFALQTVDQDLLLIKLNAFMLEVSKIHVRIIVFVYTNML